MDEILYVVLAALVALSLAVIVLYAAGFAAVAACTIRRRDHDPLAGELDRTLEEILAEHMRSADAPPQVPKRVLPLGSAGRRSGAGRLNRPPGMSRIAT